MRGELIKTLMRLLYEEIFLFRAFIVLVDQVLGQENNNSITYQDYGHFLLSLIAHLLTAIENYIVD